MRIVPRAPAVAPLVRFDATVPSKSEDGALARLLSNPRAVLGTTFVAALIDASHDDPWLLRRVASLRGAQLLVTIDRVQQLGGRTRFAVTVYPAEEPGELPLCL